MTRARSCATALLLLTLLVGCGTGDSYLKLRSGNWAFTATSAVSSNVTIYVLGNLTQSGTEVMAMMHVDDPAESPCFLLDTNVPFTGVVENQNITLTSSAISDQVITVNIAGSATSVTGTYTISGGCAAGDHGTITGVSVPPITGTWNGSFTTPSGGTFSATANLRQGDSDASGLFFVTGTVTFANSSCMSSATLGSDSLIVGDIVYLAMNTNSGVTGFTGYVSDPTTARSMAGTYTIDSGTCLGDSGSATFTKR